jgi:hypothetical protein
LLNFDESITTNSTLEYKIELGSKQVSRHYQYSYYEIYENEQLIGSGSYSCVGTTEAAEPSLSSPVEPEEREDMDMEAVAHRLVLLIVHLQEQHIRVLLRKLANLHKEID